MSLDCLGLDFSSFGDIFKSTGELVKGGVELYEKEQTAKKSSADEKKDADAAIAADVTAAKAIAAASLPSASEADKANAKFAADLQDRAGAKLSGDGQSKRAEAADKALGDAMAKWKGSPDDKFAVALVRAWQATANKARGGTIVAKGGGEDKPGKRGGSRDEGGEGGIMALLQKKVIGPVPVWGAGLGAVAAAFLGKKYLLKQRAQ